MPWYAAHLICYFQFQDGNQDTYPIWENIVLIAADAPEAAEAEAMRLGAANYTDEPRFETTYAGRPARIVFVSMRKLMECQELAIINADSGAPELSWRPGHGTEITYSALAVPTAEALQQLVAGDPVQVMYEE